MNSTFDHILKFFFKRKYIVILAATLLSTIFLIDLFFYNKFNLSALGGAIYFGGMLGYIMGNKETLNMKFNEN
jgi:hypothetical protein